MKKKSLENCKLYLILDTQVNTYEELLQITQKSVGHGVDIIQLRDKNGNAREILEFSTKVQEILQDQIPYIINDRVDLAILAKADGVHVGQEDISVADARDMMGPEALIGKSCQTLDHALQAQKEGADYIGFGSVFKTQTKPDRNPMDLERLREISREISIPVFAIGGITAENREIVSECGIQRIAVCREVCCASDIPSKLLALKSGF